MPPTKRAIFLLLRSRWWRPTGASHLHRKCCDSQWFRSGWWYCYLYPESWLQHYLKWGLCSCWCLGSGRCWPNWRGKWGWPPEIPDSMLRELLTISPEIFPFPITGRSKFPTMLYSLKPQQRLKLFELEVRHTARLQNHRLCDAPEKSPAPRKKMQQSCWKFRDSNKWWAPFLCPYFR